eukprot:COSAG03_NODE_1003_length_5054_cov_26.853280_6_plen_57_part_00
MDHLSLQFDLYVEKKKGSAVPLPGDHLPWLDVFATTEHLEVQVRYQIVTNQIYILI